MLQPPGSGRLPREAAGAGLYRRKRGDGATKRCLRPFGVTIPDASAPLWRSTVVSKRRTTPDRDFWNIP